MNIREGGHRANLPWPEELVRAHPAVPPPASAASCAAVAAALGLRFIAHPHREGFRVKAEPATDEGLRSIGDAIRSGSGVIARRGEEIILFVAPAAEATSRLASRIARSPEFRSRIAVTTPSAIRRMLLSAHARPLASDAVNRLARSRPDLSARRLVTTRGAILFVAALLGFAGTALALGGWTALALFDIAAGLLFLCLTLLRIMAFGLVADRTRQRPPPPRLDPDGLPVYTILLPLHDEPHMVEELVHAMNRLVWPREQLDIKLILEAGDARTIAAAAALRLSAPFEVVIVPPMGPRTKPKALAFALPLARGDYVTVYDAEDRPDPLQLVEAHLAFVAGDADLACLQAPLLVDNAGTNGLTALFALEYSVQFDGVLPLLSALGLPLPLGGTSNHFRREALEKVGGWDPYNVTEDADLGIRLARFGYRAAMLERPTMEEGPRTAGIWLRQRTRWLKGWMHMFATSDQLNEISYLCSFRHLHLPPSQLHRNKPLCCQHRSDPHKTKPIVLRLPKNLETWFSLAMRAPLLLPLPWPDDTPRTSLLGVDELSRRCPLVCDRDHPTAHLYGARDVCSITGPYSLRRLQPSGAERRSAKKVGRSIDRAAREIDCLKTNARSAISLVISLAEYRVCLLVPSLRRENANVWRPHS